MCHGVLCGEANSKYDSYFDISHKNQMQTAGQADKDDVDADVDDDSRLATSDYQRVASRCLAATLEINITPIIMSAISRQMAAERGGCSSLMCVSVKLNLR